MGDKISRKDKFVSLSPIDQKLEKMESLGDMIRLYNRYIQIMLNEITDNTVLQDQIKAELGL